MEIIVMLLLVLFVFLYVEILIYFGNCFKNVTFSFKPKKHFIFPGEYVEVTETISNKKLLPLWWIDTKVLVSKYLQFDNEGIKDKDEAYYKEETFSVLPYQKITKNIKFRGIKRGYYKIEKCSLLTTDLFVQQKFVKELPISETIVVYPKIISHRDLEIKLRKMNGDVLTKKHLIEDPFLIRGIRDYSPFDSFKQVNWSATAKTGDLKVNQYDYSSSGQIKIILNLEKMNDWQSDQILEESISLAASLTGTYLKSGFSVSLLTNGSDSIEGSQTEIDFKDSERASYIFYESLARLDYNKITKPVTEILAEEISKSKTDTIYILISHYYKMDLQQQLQIAKSRGIDIQWVLIFENGDNALDDTKGKTLTETELNLRKLDNMFMWEVGVDGK